MSRFALEAGAGVIINDYMKSLSNINALADLEPRHIAILSRDIDCLANRGVRAVRLTRPQSTNAADTTAADTTGRTGLFALARMVRARG